MSAVATGWEGILAPGEEILWQGRPRASIRWTGLLTPLTFMGVIFTGFSTFWIAMAAVMTAGSGAPFPFNVFPLFGLPFLAVGLWMLGGRLLFDAWGPWILVAKGWTPFPYKVLTIAAGVFKMSFVPFILASIVARAMNPASDATKSPPSPEFMCL
jgi:hypothetical protein